MSLGSAQKVLIILEAAKSPLSTGFIGEQLWGNGTRMPQHYARPAGRVLNRLREAGLVVRVHRGGKDFMGWQITEAGLRARGLTKITQKISSAIRSVIREENKRIRPMSRKKARVTFLSKEEKDETGP